MGMGLIERALAACVLGALLMLVELPAAQAGEAVTLQLKWLHQFQFAGYYAALDQGYYAEAGLDVTLREGGPEVDAELEVAEGRAQYGIGNSNLVLARAAGRPFVALAVVLQHSPEILLTRRQPDIASLSDLAGKRLMDAPLSVAVAAMLTRSGIDVAALPRVPNRGNAGDLLDGKADMMVAYSTNEPFAFERVGRPYMAFSPRAVGVDFYGDTLFTTEQEVRDHPDRAAALRAASLRGWQYAMQHPVEMVESILAHHGGNREQLLFEAQEMERLMQPELVPLGEMNPERWRRIAQVFAESGLLPPGFDVAPLLYRPEGAVIPAGLVWGMAALGVAVLLSTLAVLRMARLRRGLQQSEARFRTLVEDSPVGIFHYDSDLVITYVNATFAAIMCSAPDRLLGLSMHNLRDQGPLPAIRAPLDGRRGRYEGPYRSSLSGRDLLVSMTCAPLRDSDGTVTGGIGIVEDITERVAADSERRTLLQAVEQSPVAVVVTDVGGTIRFVNRAFEVNTGYGRDEVVGQNPRLLQGGDKSAEEYAELWRTITGGGVWSGEFHNRRKDNSLYWERAVIAPVRDSSGTIVQFVGVKEDITEKRAHDEEMRRLVAHLTEANTELERFAYVASHDLREPLRTVASFSQLLKRRYHGKLDAEADEFIDLVVGAASRMHALIGDLLTYSRVTGKGSPFAPVDSAAVCVLALSNLRESIEEAAATVDIQPLPGVTADEVQLMQLFQNLIGNAIKFRRSGHPPTITVSCSGGVFAVADDGIGIAHTDQDIYEIFRRLNSAETYPGTGVGLAICKRIVQRHGGRLWHEPRPGGGTVFRFTLEAEQPVG